jgi:hypothetical protein
MMLRHALVLGLAACLLACAGSSHASGLTSLDDDDLSHVHGRDGLAFNLSGFSLDGPLTFTYTSSDTGNPSFWLSNFYLARSDDATATFSDPYTLNIVARDGLADAIVLNNPLNANGLLKWQFAADFGIQADSTTFNGGALVIQDMVFYGGGISLSTPAGTGTEGIAFGLSLNVDIGNLLIRPRGRGDITVATADEQMAITGIHLKGANGGAWALADVTNQPGIINAVTDANGNSTLHVGIGWSTAAAGAPVGSLVIDNISFTTAGTTMNLGASRIEGIQLHYLDIKFR